MPFYTLLNSFEIVLLLEKKLSDYLKAALFFNMAMLSSPDCYRPLQLCFGMLHAMK